MWETDMEAAVAVAVDAVDDYAVDTAADVAAAEAAADAAEAAADAAVAVDDPAYDRSNWSADDRKRVEDLELAYENASLAAQQAAEEAAEKARKKLPPTERSEEHTAELQSIMRISYAAFSLK